MMFSRITTYCGHERSQTTLRNHCPSIDKQFNGIVYIICLFQFTAINIRTCFLHMYCICLYKMTVNAVKQRHVHPVYDERSIFFQSIYINR